MQWEYLTLNVDRGFWVGTINEEKLQTELNNLGAARWELVTCVETNQNHGATNEVLLIFKRPRPQS